MRNSTPSLCSPHPELVRMRSRSPDWLRGHGLERIDARLDIWRASAQGGGLAHIKNEANGGDRHILAVDRGARAGSPRRIHASPSRLNYCVNSVELRRLTLSSARKTKGSPDTHPRAPAQHHRRGFRARLHASPSLLNYVTSVESIETPQFTTVEL
jgi:hypothetical protein